MTYPSTKSQWSFGIMHLYYACLQITVCLTKVNKTKEYKQENPTVMQSSKCPNIQKRKAL